MRQMSSAVGATERLNFVLLQNFPILKVATSFRQNKTRATDFMCVGWAGGNLFPSFSSYRCRDVESLVATEYAERQRRIVRCKTCGHGKYISQSVVKWKCISIGKLFELLQLLCCKKRTISQDLLCLLFSYWRWNAKKYEEKSTNKLNRFNQKLVTTRRPTTWTHSHTEQNTHKTLLHSYVFHFYKLIVIIQE